MSEEDYKNEEPIVETTHGKIRGKLLHGIYGDPYYCFESVPYAASPLGPHRFKSPRPLQPWTGIRECTITGPVCLQLYNNKLVGSEDCLNLSIYVKLLRSSKPLPILVYVHGGMFKRGDYTRRDWGPDYLMQEELIVISVGHRLGAYGFLSFPDDPTLEVSGNAGLKDIICALRWIKANASNFNGDPMNITLGGHSSGSISVQWLLASSQTEGLFHRAILQGGYGPESQCLPNIAYRLAVQQGYQGPNESRFIFEYLKGLPSEQLADFHALTDEEKNMGLLIAFAPVVEASWCNDAVVTSEPVLAQRTSWSNHIPLLLGATENESLYSSYGKYTKDPTFYEKIHSEPQRKLPNVLQWRCPLELQHLLGKQLLAVHIGRLCEAIELDSYNLVYHNMHRFVESRRRYSTQPVYLQRFAMDSRKFSFYRNRALGDVFIPGVGHADELLFLFHRPGFSVAVCKNSDEYKTMRRMVSMWSAFITRGNPNTPEIEPQLWSPVDPTSAYKCLNVDRELTLIESPEYRKNLVRDGWYKQAELPLY
ncbi:esterase B1-like [Scaptodrosophila lebanonensis]|uniref:carboxylesterase n=1 Tax=Drosophila lebanonensis TaxID=7225 RepID=A0A6J2UBP3_DROLE|nr:esterase B1-like [Scaptodrosophila lebanonensis]